MSYIFQDTSFGRLIRFVTKGRIFSWPEFRDERLLQLYLEADKRKPNKDESDRQSADDKDYILITWLDKDPQNPQNWTSSKKIFVTAQICLLTTSVYIGSSIYTPGIPDVAEKFGVSTVAALLGLTMFILGYGIGPMLWSPMSEMPYIGRNPIYLITLIIFVALQPAVIYAKNFGMLLAFRFLTGIFGSPALATGGASLADMYSPDKIQYSMSIWGLAAGIGPVLGPLIGGFAAESKGWTWTIWELMWLSGFCATFLLFFFPETSSANIIFRRTLRLRKILDDRKTATDSRVQTKSTSLPIKCEPEIAAEGFTGKGVAMMILVRPFTLTFLEPIVFLLNLYLALVYALLYLWFESFPIVFGGVYHFNQGTQGLAFLGILIGLLATLVPYWMYLRWRYEPMFAKANGILPPEVRLEPFLPGSFFIPVCLFIFAWTSRESVHWIVPIIGTSLFAPGIFMAFMAVLGYLGDAYPADIASVYAGNDLARASFGASFPLFANAMFHKLGIDWGNTLLALLSVVFIPIPFILFKYGRTLRMRSRHARHDI